MPTYKRSSYDLFIHKVLLPNIRTILLALAVIALGCGSWLETNTSGDCTFQNSMSVFEVSIYQNISDPYALTPSSVSFGLWKHCFYYAQNCTCTPISLGYGIDAEQSIFAATNNQTMPPTGSDHSSYIRLIPLIIGIALSCAAFAYSFWANRSSITRPFFFWINGGVALVSAALVALAFGWTYQSYKSSIITACQAANVQSVRCASMAPKLEVILLAVALGLLVLASVLFGCVGKTDMDDTIQEVYIDEKVPSSRRHSSFLQAIHRNSRMKSSSHLSDASSASKEPAMYGTDDAMEAWKDVTMLDRQTSDHYQQQQELNTIPLRPPPAIGTRRSNEISHRPHHTTYERRHSSNNNSNTRPYYNMTIAAKVATSSSTSSSSSSSIPASPTAAAAAAASTNYYYQNNNSSGSSGGKRRQRQGSSSPTPSPRQERSQTYQHYDLPNDSNELIPPTLPFAAHHRPERRRQSSQQSSSNQPRPSSHASGNTFGANDVLVGDDSPLSSTFTLEDQHRHHQQQQQQQQQQQHNGYFGSRQRSDASFRPTTPGSYRNDHADSRDSICFTPTFNDRSSSGVSLSNQQAMQQYDTKRKNSSGTPIYYPPPAAAAAATSSSPSSSSPSNSAKQYQDRSSSPSRSHVPTLQTPPSSRHPLSHKVINDERIGAYFQQPRHSPQQP